EDKRDVIRELIVKEEGIAMAAEVMTRFSADEIAYFHEISKEKYELDMRAHRDEAWEGGLEQGLEKGREEIARTLLNRGWAAEETAELTKLPLEKVRSLP
ncbi:MAG: hypothetical protein LBD09_02045, partial [Treponema sp.]|nr:hypothetical protein [Treponema sp.]